MILLETLETGSLCALGGGLAIACKKCIEIF
jgi:hypothetical protein